MPLAIGASFTGLMMMASGTPVALTAVMPPFRGPDTSTPAMACGPDRRSAPTVAPASGTSLELSINLAVSGTGIPLKFTAGTKATSVARDSTRALASLTPAEMATQVAPPSVE